MTTASVWCSNRSRSADVSVLSLLKIFDQSLNTRLVVITIDPRSYRWLIIWKSKSAPFLSMGRYPNSSKTTRDGLRYFFNSCFNTPVFWAEIRLLIVSMAEANSTVCPFRHAWYPSADARWVFPKPTPPIKTTLLLSSMNFNRNRF